MTPVFPVIELIDRLAIAKLKFEKTQANKEELDFYTKQIEPYNLTFVMMEVLQLYDIHLQIWDLEALLKSGRESELPLEEIGRRAIEIRNLNNKRVALKNTIAEKLGCVVREIKKDHISE